MKKVYRETIDILINNKLFNRITVKYDKFGKEIERTDTNSNITKRVYDEHGLELHGIEDGNKYNIEYTTDNIKKSVILRDGSSYNYYYTHDNKLMYTELKGKILKNYRYNFNNELIYEKDHINDITKIYKYGKRYEECICENKAQSYVKYKNNKGNIVREEYGDDRIVKKIYNEDNRIIFLKDLTNSKYITWNYEYYED